MREPRSTTERRRWTGRIIRLMTGWLAGFIGAALGVVPYLDLTEGPFVGSDDRFEQPGWDGSDCYWSPEAAQVADRFAQAFVIVPCLLVLAMAVGFLFAERRGATAQVRSFEAGLAAVDAAVGCVFVALASGLAVGAVHGFTIGRLLDPGCVEAGVPGLPVTVVAISVSVLGAGVVGVWLERQSSARRAARTDSPPRKQHRGIEQPA